MVSLSASLVIHRALQNVASTRQLVEARVRLGSGQLLLLALVLATCHNWSVELDSEEVV